MRRFKKTWDKMRCPYCDKRYELDWTPGEPLPTSYPFCSIRCKMLDLGKMFEEGGVYLEEE